MRYSRLFFWVFLSVVFITPLFASTAAPVEVATTQYEQCTELVEAALATTDEVCDGTGRNFACYGHDMLDAEPNPGFGPFSFSQAGDTVNVAHLNSLRLSPMNVDAGTWGVALLELQADIPDDRPQNVSLLLFGDVEVRNLVPEPILMDALVDSLGNANVRKDPEEAAFVMGTLPPGSIVTARGRSEDDEWIYIDLPDEEGAYGWVSRSLLQLSDEYESLTVIDPYFTQYGPMQAFYLKTGRNQTTCAEAPSDGLLVQTPEGIAEVRLWINEVKIRLGSTAYIQAEPGNRMTINTLEGTAHVEAMGVEQVAMAGSGVTVQLDQNSSAAAPPSKPKAYQAQEVGNLPTKNLERQIVPVVTATNIPATATNVPTATNTPAPANQAISTAEVTAEPTNTMAPPATFTPLPTATRIPPTNTIPAATNEVVPSNTPIPTNPPPTVIPPTVAPTTAVPPTTVPPTTAPTTVVPPTVVPPEPTLASAGVVATVTVTEPNPAPAPINTDPPSATASVTPLPEETP